jgi:magnesium-transporting ATPase (P-type)
MITGDHPDTAKAIAQKLGFVTADGRAADKVKKADAKTGILELCSLEFR